MERIKINESQFQQLVESAVKSALTELDWKTYASAAAKRSREFGDNANSKQRERVRNLDAAANKALRQKYPSPKGHPYHTPQIETNYDDYHGHEQVGRYPQLGAGADFNDTFVKDLDNSDNNWESTSFFDNDRIRDMRGYFNGTSKYKKGEGWSNESKLHEAVFKAVKDALRKL